MSLGYFEAEDCVAVVSFLRALRGVAKLGVWGRSMGSVAALLYAATRDPDMCWCVRVGASHAPPRRAIGRRESVRHDARSSIA